MARNMPRVAREWRAVCARRTFYGLACFALLLGGSGESCAHDQLDQFNVREGAISTIEPVVFRSSGSNLCYLSCIVRRRVARDTVPCDHEDCWASSFYIHGIRFFGTQSAQAFQGVDEFASGGPRYLVKAMFLVGNECCPIAHKLPYYRYGSKVYIGQSSLCCSNIGEHQDRKVDARSRRSTNILGGYLDGSLDVFVTENNWSPRKNVKFNSNPWAIGGDQRLSVNRVGFFSSHWRPPGSVRRRIQPLLVRKT